MESKIQQQFNTLNRLYKESDEIYSGIATQFGLSDTTFWILYAITHTEGDCTQYDLSKNWFYPVQTINSAVANLQKKGLVQLEVIPNTRNRKNILLTTDGEKFTKIIIAKIDEIEANAFSMFTEEERETYISLYKRHNENIRREKDKLFNNIGEQLK